ncbi:MAG: hypothetical protein R3F39_06995 [Myxococcota bacterium]
MVALTQSGCSLPLGDQSTPESAHYAVLQARQAGDLDALWALLDPATAQLFTRWVAAEKKAVEAVRLRYPSDKQAAALAALDGGRRGGLPDGQSLFRVFATGGVIEPLSRMAQTGAHVRSVAYADGGAQATVRTWAGDEVALRRGDDGQWYLALRPEEASRLETAVRTAESNLKRVEGNIDVFSGKAATP